MLIWLLSLLLPVLSVLSYNFADELPQPFSPHWHLQSPCSLCRGPALQNEPAPLVYLLVYAAVFCPLGLHACLLSEDCYLSSREKWKNRNRKNESQLTENRRIHTMLISIVVTFGACWLPSHSFNVSNQYHEVLMNCHHNLVFAVCHLVAMVSTCIKPLFHGFLNKNFQKDLVVLVHLCWRFALQERYCYVHSAHRWSEGSLWLVHITTGI